MNEQIGTIPTDKMLGMEIDLLSKLRSGAITATQLGRFLKKQNPFFKTHLIRVGNLGSLEKLDMRLKELNSHEETWFLNGSSEILHPVEELIEIVMVTPAELGYTSVTYEPSEFFEKATSEKVGFELCPVEVAFHLLFLEKFRTVNEWLHIASKPLELMGTNEMLSVNPYERSFGSWYLGQVGGRDANYINLHDVWVFKVPEVQVTA
jgi:hypothetical protein